jgi:hypothetical protein
MRRIRTLAVALVAVAGAVLASSTATGAPAASRAGSHFYGLGLSTTPSEADYARMARGGVRVVRFTADWRAVQPTSVTFNWAGVDAAVGRAAKHGISTFGTMFGTAPWVSPNFIQAPVFSAQAQSAWRTFLSRAVARYGPHGSFWSAHPKLPYHPVHDWQIWNEENSPGFFAPKPDPSAYLTLLKISDQAIRAVDPHARIVLGGMFKAKPSSGTGAIHSWTFLAQLYHLGAAPYFDIIGAHPYSPKLSGFKFQLRKLHAASEHHDPLWIDEIGWGSGRPSSSPLNKGLKGQASFLRKSFSFATKNRRRLGIARIVWFSWRDAGNTPPDCAYCGFTGLRARNGGAKPSWRAFTRLSKR